jgi:hypothetical protein
MEQPHYTTPDQAIGELETATNQLIEQGQSVDWLRAHGMDAADTTRLRLQQLMAFTDNVGRLAVEVALQGISQNSLTQTKAAELLDVHPVTVGRWVQAARAGEPITGRPKRFKRQP